jgi:hypothetical protein
MDLPDYVAPVRIVSQSFYPKTGRHNVRLCRPGAPVDREFWRCSLAPMDVVVSNYTWVDETTGEHYLYLTWVDTPPAEPEPEHWDRP